MRKDINIAVWSREVKIDVRHDHRLQILKKLLPNGKEYISSGSVRNNWLKLHQRRPRLDIRKNFLRIVKYRDRLLKKVV